MKTQNILFPLVTAVLLVWTTGCDNKKDATTQDRGPGTADGVSDALKKTTDAVKETEAKVVTDVKDAGTKVVTDVTEKAKEVAAPASAQAQELLDSAQSLIGEGKLQDALAKLKAVSGEKLSTEQQALADSLKAQIDKLLGTTSKAATDAAAAAGNLLKK